MKFVFSAVPIVGLLVATGLVRADTPDAPTSPRTTIHDHRSHLDTRSATSVAPSNSPSADSGDLVVILVNVDGTTTQGALLKRYDNSWNFIDEKVTDSNGEAQWPGIPAATYNLEAYYTGTFFGVEFWASDAATVTTGSVTIKTLYRTYPFVESIVFKQAESGDVLQPGDEIPLGTPVRAEVNVRNDVPAGLVSTVRLLADPDGLFPYDVDLTSQPQRIRREATGVFTVEFKPRVAGTWYRAFETTTTLLNTNTVRTDAARWEAAFSVKPFPVTQGSIVFHRWTSYDAYDGELYLVTLSTGELRWLSEGWDIDNAANAHFSPDGTQLTFMGVPTGQHDYASWEIYVWDVRRPETAGEPRRLTANAIPDEDPKFSFAGDRICFKRDGDLAIYDLTQDQIEYLTTDGFTTEEWAPFFSNDDRFVYYTSGEDRTADIMRIDVASGQITLVESISGVQEYYPIVRSDGDYFYSRWVSSHVQRDNVYMRTPSSNTRLPFNTDDADYADAYPVGESYVLLSSTKDAPGGWNLFLGDVTTGELHELALADINTPMEELGAAYTAYEQTAPTGIIASGGGAPLAAEIGSVYPNPFNPTTTIRFALPRGGHIRLSIHDVTGRRVALLVDRRFEKGTHEITWEGVGSDNVPLPSGVYFLRLESPYGAQTRKLVLLK